MVMGYMPRRLFESVWREQHEGINWVSRPRNTGFNRAEDVRLMIKRRAAATRAKLNTVARVTVYESSSEKFGLEINSVYLAGPETTIIHRVDEPGFHKPRVCAGDLVVADRRVTPRQGSLVIASIEGERIVGLLTARGGREYLQRPGENGNEDQEITDDSRIEILASVVSVIPVIRGS